jgi:hypothetical protein
MLGDCSRTRQRKETPFGLKHANLLARLVMELPITSNTLGKRPPMFRFTAPQDNEPARPNAMVPNTNVNKDVSVWKRQ